MYNSRPKIKGENLSPIYKNAQEIINELNRIDFKILAFECYPGVDENFLKKIIIDEITDVENVIHTSDYILKNDELNEVIAGDLTEDELFGKFIWAPLDRYVIRDKHKQLMKKVEDGRSILIGVGASQLVDADQIVYINISRHEILLRYEEGMTNWQLSNNDESLNKKTKRGYYFEWPLANQIKEKALKDSNYVIDMNKNDHFAMLHTSDYFRNLELFTTQAFRLVPFFSPGVWGGEWMQDKFQVKQSETNLAWAFDGVPEENSIIFEIEGSDFEFPANDIVHFFPRELMGEKVYGRYGKNFPIRFNYLDTMNGQNLSLQVHPTTDYAYKTFGSLYTQDESYYIMDCKEGAEVFLGVLPNITAKQLIPALNEAKETHTFNHKKYIHSIKVNKHDHLLIPSGTIHSSGANCVVLEISTTPNRFTFKLWDWNRVDLDGRPRPINIEHGSHNIDYSRDKNFVEKYLYNDFKLIHDTESHQTELTGLFPSEPLITERDTFNQKTIFETNGNVQMLCLVEGDEILVKTEDTLDDEGIVIHYGEKFIIPAKVSKYSMTPIGNSKGKFVKTMKAYVR